MNLDMVFTYLDFVVDRHSIWEKRQQGQPGPWSDDEILRRNKFTNVYRVLDYGSQFLLGDLLNDGEAGPLDAVARSMLYRLTNEPESWRVARQEMGVYPLAHEMDEDLADLWCEHRDAGNRVFSGAYTIMPLPGVKGFDKVREVVRMVYRAFHPDSPTNVRDEFLAAGTMAERFKVLRSIPSVGDFIAMQVLTDYGYSPHGADQDENDFVIAGPGARKGAAELFPAMKPGAAIAKCRELVLDLDDCPSLRGRPPSLMDIQNTLCEFSKYARFMRKPTPARQFKPLHPGPAPALVLPTHWPIT